MVRVLIAGYGYVGAALAQLLDQQGIDVFVLHRRAQPDSPGNRSGSGSSIRAVRADLTAFDTLIGLPTVDLIYYMPSAPADHAQAVYVDGVRNVLSACETAGPAPRLIYVSSTGVFGQSDGSWVDENSPTEPSRPVAQAILRGEEIARGAHHHAVVRFSGIYGPGRTRLIERVRNDRAELSAGPPQWTNRIHRDDCAGFLAHLATLTPWEPTYLATDDCPVPLDDVIRWLAQALGKPAPPIADVDTKVDGRIQGQNKRCRNRLLHRSGYRLRYPTFREGYRAVIND